jgi:hypothetical protein
MYGVVLWSDPHERKAVIWCEDHGDLAFFSDDRVDVVALDAGDLVSFDMRTDADMRLALNPRVVKERAYAGLQQMLDGAAIAKTRPQAEGQSARIIPFAPRRPGPARDNQRKQA